MVSSPVAEMNEHPKPLLILCGGIPDRSSTYIGEGGVHQTSLLNFYHIPHRHNATISPVLGIINEANPNSIPIARFMLANL